MISDLRLKEDELDLWLVQGADRFRRDGPLAESLLAVARHSDSRRCLLLLNLILETPSSQTGSGLCWSPASPAIAASPRTDERRFVMTASNVYLLCFAFGFFWAVASLLLGSFHVHGHVHAAHVHPHGGHATHAAGKGSFGSKLWGEFLNMHSLAIFLAWFGGCGFLMTRHSRVGVAAILLVSVLGGLLSAFAMASFLHFLQGKERSSIRSTTTWWACWGAFPVPFVMAERARFCTAAMVRALRLALAATRVG